MVNVPVFNSVHLPDQKAYNTGMHHRLAPDKTIGLVHLHSRSPTQLPVRAQEPLPKFKHNFSKI